MSEPWCGRVIRTGRVAGWSASPDLEAPAADMALVFELAPSSSLGRNHLPMAGMLPRQRTGRTPLPRPTNILDEPEMMMNEFPSAAPGNSCFLCAQAIDPEASRLLRNGEAIHLACARALMAEAFGDVVPPAVWFSWPPAPTGADTPETLPTDPPPAGPSSPSQPDGRNHAVQPPAPPAPPPVAPIS
jgi:hypothetical protein